MLLQPLPDGEVGELTITTFRREASPVVRYRTGDRVVHVPHTDCPCGRPFAGIVPAARKLAGRIVEDPDLKAAGIVLKVNGSPGGKKNSIEAELTARIPAPLLFVARHTLLTFVERGA